MKYLARGSIIFGVLALIMTMFYFQPTVEAALITANDSQNDQAINIQEIIKQNIKTEDLLNNNLDNLDLTEEAVFENSDDNEEAEAEAAVVVEARSYKATAYCLRGKTASGSRVRRGIVAADPRVLPLGTRIQITAGKYSGTYTVADTGGRIRGRILDIWVPSCGEARRFGRKSIKVAVISKGKKRKNKKRRRKG